MEATGVLGLAHGQDGGDGEGVAWVCRGGVTLQQSKLACLRARGKSGCGELGHVELWLPTGKLGTRTGRRKAAG